MAGDVRLALRGLGVAFAGLGISLILALLTTVLMNATNVIPAETNLLNKPMLEERVRPGWYAVVAAFAAGIAGTVALTRAKTDTLVGTVAALALVPAIAAAGIGFLRGFGGVLLLAINVVLIIAMGIPWGSPAGRQSRAFRHAPTVSSLRPQAVVAVMVVLALAHGFAAACVQRSARDGLRRRSHLPALVTSSHSLTRAVLSPAGDSR